MRAHRSWAARSAVRFGSNKLFYFGSWERNDERQGIFNTYTVPTAKMRNGDFSEVLALNSTFRIYDPATGTSTGADRSVLRERDHSGQSHQQHLEEDPDARTRRRTTPARTTASRTTCIIPRNPKADRDNYDVKVNWNRTSAHQIWGKFSMMQASVFDLFYLPFDDAGGGDTTNIWCSRCGQTWTLSPTLLLDGNVGVNIDAAELAGSGLRHQLRPRRLGHSRA